MTVNWMVRALRVLISAAIAVVALGHAAQAQKAASFSLDQVMEKLQTGGAAK